MLEAERQREDDLADLAEAGVRVEGLGDLRGGAEQVLGEGSLPGPCGMPRYLIELRRIAAIGDGVSVLRVFDVITWMEGKENRLEPATPEERLGAVLAEEGTPRVPEGP